MENQEKTSDVCHYCHNTIVKCSEWLDSCKLSDDSSSVIYEESLNSETTASSEDNLVEVDDVIATRNDNVHVHDEIVIAENSNKIIELDRLLSQKCSRYQNIHINRSKNVHIGDVMQINGPVYVNQLNPTISQNIVINQPPPPPSPNRRLFIVARTRWLAQPPLDPDDVKFLKKPVKFVIISHSASEEAHTQARNNLLVRIIQQLHIESYMWNDIGYNFLVGAEGSVYEGRGWDYVGAHTFKYNRVSIGICFIGTFINKLPPPVAITKAKELIEYGVEIGAIDPDYRILAHCQCSSTLSPGRRFFEEIKKWDRWDSSVSVGNPPPLVDQLENKSS